MTFERPEAFHAEHVERHVIQLFALVSDGIAGATHALLSGDRQAAKVLVQRDETVDSLYAEVEAFVQGYLARSDSPEQLRYLVSVLRMLPELERSGDLAEHIAKRTMRGLAADMSARSRGLVGRMGEVASAMWRMAADAFGDRDASVAERLEELDDEMDELHALFTAELAGGEMSIPVVIELVLVARFYERLGDHAVNLTRRVPSWPGDERDTTTSPPPAAGERPKSGMLAGDATAASC